MKIEARDWPAVSALFDEALDLPQEQREPWLDRLPPGQRDWRPTLERLLEAHEAARRGAFLQALPASKPAPEADASGRTIGPYRVLRRIGHGGMGTVWLAERVDGSFRRQVALKLPHPGLFTDTFAERLLRERDILAGLSHRHIARLYDAGVTDDGQPFIALAHVSGLPLLEHCEAHRLGLRERILLFMQVLDAVQYAHGRLVVHRDLKPSNVMVDESGQVQLLDFGIAKLMVDGAAEPTALTADLGQAFTPDYASPEQVVGGPIGIASDVYSLGVLLYELLARNRPYRLARADLALLARAVAEVAVERPSAAALAAGHADLARALRGDLDTIVLKALKKEPAERYATADAFRQDLGRHLDGEPVLARPDSVAYRMGKFVRRHRFGSAAALALALALGAGAAGTAWQAHRARQQAERAQAVKDFLVGLFNDSDPQRARGRTLSAHDLLERGQRQLEAKLDGQPELRHELSGVLAGLYDKLDDDPKALPLAETHRDLALKLYGPESLEYGDALSQLADIQGNLDHAQGLALFQQARQVLQRHAGQRTRQLLRDQTSMAYLLGHLGRFQEAADQLRGLLAPLAREFGPASFERVHATGLLLYDETQLGQLAEAADHIAQVEPLLEGVAAEHPLDVAVVRNNIALAQLRLWRPQPAELQARRGLADFEALIGPDAPQTLMLRRIVAEALEQQGRYGEAAQAFVTVAKDAERVLGAGHRLTRIFQSSAVDSLLLTGRAAEGLDFARRAVAAGQAAEVGLYETGFTNTLGLALVFGGQAAEAAALLARQAERLRQAGQDQGDDYGRTLLRLAGAQAALGHTKEAAETAALAAAVFGRSPRGPDMQVAQAQLTQALARARDGDATGALALVAQARGHLARVVGPDHAMTLLARLVQAQVQQAAGMPQAPGDASEAVLRRRLHDEAGISLPAAIPLVF